MERIMAYVLRVDEGAHYRGYFETLENDLHVLQGRVGGRIDVFPLSGELIVIASDDGISQDRPPNRMVLRDGRAVTVLFGDLLVVRSRGEEFASVYVSDKEFIEASLVPAVCIGGRYYVSHEPLEDWGEGV